MTDNVKLSNFETMVKTIFESISIFESKVGEEFDINNANHVRIVAKIEKTKLYAKKARKDNSLAKILLEYTKDLIFDIQQYKKTIIVPDKGIITP